MIDEATARRSSTRSPTPSSDASCWPHARLARRRRGRGRARLPLVEGARDGLAATVDVRPIGVEQSSTSIVFAEPQVLKAFRRLRPGQNPELELLASSRRASSGASRRWPAGTPRAGCSTRRSASSRSSCPTAGTAGTRAGRVSSRPEASPRPLHALGDGRGAASFGFGSVSTAPAARASEPGAGRARFWWNRPDTYFNTFIFISKIH